MNTRTRCNTFRILGLALICLAFTSPVFALEFFEDFNGKGEPPNHADYWYCGNDIYTAQDSWNEFIPGDGYAYITVDNSSSWGAFAIIGIGWIPKGHRMEVRMKGALVTGYTGFIFTYAPSADEIDIELVPDDTQGEGGVHDPYEWSDARFNTTIHGDNWNANFKGIVDASGNKVSHYEDDTFHTYTIDWFTDRVVFYIDGVHQHTCTWSIPQDDSEIILGFRNLSWAGTPNWTGTRTMTIDWLNVQPIDSGTPVANADIYATDPDTTINIAGPGILANDTGSSLEAHLVSDVAHGTLLLNTDGSFTYTPDSGFIGEDHFVYFAKDGTSNSESNTAQVLLRVGQPAEWQKVDDTNANINYDSNWGIWEGNPGYISTEHFCETVGGKATFTFTGNQARYYGFKRNDLGFADILVDGVLVTTLDLYSSSALYDYLLYETEILPWGEHTMTIRVKGTQNSSSSGYEVIIDAFSWIDNGAVTTAPAANFTSSVSDMTVDFTDGSTDNNGTIASWDWNFGDGDASTLQNPSHTYTVDDTYTVTLTVTDNDGETNSTSRSITVPAPSNSPPDPNPMTWSVEPYRDPAWPTYIVGTMTASEATDADGGIEYFFDCIEAPDGGGWNGGEDSGWQTSNTFSDWYLLDGYTYTYRVKARDALENETNWSAEAAITIGGGNIPPTASISYVCTNLDCGFTDNSSDSDGTIVSRLWDFGDTTGSTDQNPSHTYAAAGTYNVTLTVTDDDDATNSVTLPVTVTVLPTADFSFITSDLTANFLDLSSDSDGDIVWWEWDFDDGNTSDDQNPIQIHTYAATGTYYVTLTVTDDDDATDSVTLPVTVTAPSLPSVPAAPTDLGVEFFAKTQIDLSWVDNADNETGFKIERSKRTTRSFVEIATVDPDITYYYSDTTVRKGTTYYYRVRATNAGGDSAYSNVVFATTPKK